MKLVKRSGNLCLWDGKSGITEIEVSLKAELDGGTVVIVPTGEWDISEDGPTVTACCENFRLETEGRDGGILLRTTYIHTAGKRIQKMHTLTVLCGQWSAAINKLMTNDLFAVNGNEINEMQAMVHSVKMAETDGPIRGGDVMAWIDDDGKNVIAGFASFLEYFSVVTAERNGRIALQQNMESHPLEEGESVCSDAVWLCVCGDVRIGLITYADVVASLMQVSLGNWETPVGFCTWYYYLRYITQNTIYENLEALDANRKSLPIKYVQIDDGWFYYSGHWEPTNYCPDGMKRVADEIKAHGYIPGIWLSPFVADFGEDDPRRDWFVKNWDDDTCYKEPALDFSHPEARKFLFEVFHKVSHDWGYRYIKIDLITNRLAPGRYFDPSFTALKNFREGMKIIRSAVTEDTFLLACTAPLSSAAGICDGMRVSGDIFGEWNSVKHIYNAVFKRYYTNRRWYINDADCLIIRKSENEDLECRRNCTRNDDEIQTFVTAMAASGGILMLSDKLGNLSGEQIQLLSKLFPLNTETALPLDLMDSVTPGYLDLGRRGHMHIYALINWSDEPCSMTVQTDGGYAFEFWGQEYLGMTEGSFTAEVGAHCSKVIYITDITDASVIGVDDCIVPTVRQSITDGILNGVFLKESEQQTIASPHTLRALEGCKLELLREGDVKLYTVKAAVDEKSYKIAIIKE